MKKIQTLILVLLVAVVAFQGLALAATVSGKVEKVDAATNMVTLTTAAGEKKEISVKPETTYAGVASLADLKEGQDVSIEASEEGEGSGKWAATSVKVEAAAPAPAM